MPEPIAPVVLSGALCVLRPLTNDDVSALVAAASGDRSSFAYTWVPEPTADDVADYIALALADHRSGHGLTFATCARDGTVVGSTRFMNAEYWTTPNRRMRDSSDPDAIEIGSTWLCPAAQRTGINTEAKQMMLSHAFDTLGVRRVTIKTDARNQVSRAAIERIGARLDGVLRAHMRATDGTERDSAWYSIVAAEWPSVNARLTTLLDRHR